MRAKRHLHSLDFVISEPFWKWFRKIIAYTKNYCNPWALKPVSSSYHNDMNDSLPLFINNLIHKAMINQNHCWQITVFFIIICIIINWSSLFNGFLKIYGSSADNREPIEYHWVITPFWWIYLKCEFFNCWNKFSELW